MITAPLGLTPALLDTASCQGKEGDHRKLGEEKKMGNGDCPSCILHSNADSSLSPIFQREKLSWIPKSVVEPGTGMQPTWRDTSIQREASNERRELLSASVYPSVKWGKEFLIQRLSHHKLAETSAWDLLGRFPATDCSLLPSSELKRMEQVLADHSRCH